MAQAHSLTPSPPLPTLLLTRAKKKNTTLQHFGFQQPHCSHLKHGVVQATAARTYAEPIDRRRTFVWGLIGVAMGMELSSQNANAAGRRPPPPPPTEKKDLSLTALQAKVLANKKRKEAMKAEVARLREKGKIIESKEVTESKEVE